MGTRIVIALAAGALLSAKTHQARSTWDELPANLAGKQVRVEPADRRIVKGKLARIRPDGLELERRGGQQDVARSSVSKISWSERKRVRWQAAGAVIGAGAASPLLGITEGWRQNEGGVYSNRNTGIAAAIVAGAGVLGYFAGRAADTDTEVLTIVP